MRVTVLGSSGFLGSRIANEARKRGWTVVGVGSRTKNSAELIASADAVIHSVGAFMSDTRYKKLVSSPVTPCSLVKLASMRMGLDPPSPLDPSLDDINVGTVEHAIAALATKRPATPARTPFAYVSAAQWELAGSDYVASKRRAERLLRSARGIRPVFLRPGMIVPPRANSLLELTPRHLIDIALKATNSPFRVSVDAVAEAACDAVADESLEDVIDCAAIRELDSPSFQ